MKKETLQIIFSIILLALIILFEFQSELAWVKVIYNIFSTIWALALCFVGGYLIFRCIKPVMTPNETMQDDLKEIKEQWDWDGAKGEPPLYYVHDQACRYERARIYTKVGLFVLGIILIGFGLSWFYQMI